MGAGSPSGTARRRPAAADRPRRRGCGCRGRARPAPQAPRRRVVLELMPAVSVAEHGPARILHVELLDGRRRGCAAGHTGRLHRDTGVLPSPPRLPGGRSNTRRKKPRAGFTRTESRVRPSSVISNRTSGSAAPPGCARRRASSPRPAAASPMPRQAGDSGPRPSPGQRPPFPREAPSLDGKPPRRPDLVPVDVPGPHAPDEGTRRERPA